MGVRMKLGLSYLAMVLMIVILGIYALVSMANMQEAATNAETSALKYMKQADDLNVAVSEYKAAMYKMLDADDEHKKNLAAADLQKATATIDKILPELADGIAFPEKMQETQANWAKTRSHGDKVTSILRAQGTAAAYDYMMNEMYKDYHNLDNNTTELGELELKDAQDKVAASHSIYESARTTTVVVILIIALLTVGIGYYFYRLIGGFLSQFLDVSQRVYHGDMTVNLDYDTQDEFGKIASSYNDTLGKIRGITAEIQKIANELTDSAETMSTGVNESAQVVNSIAVSINDIAELSLSQNKNVDTASTALM